MKLVKLVIFGVVCAAAGAVTSQTYARSKAAYFSIDGFSSATKRENAEFLLQGAEKAGEDGSWEQIAIGRVWYLSGNKEKGQAVFDRVTSRKKVSTSDWERIARVYLEANEWPKAKAAIDKAVQLIDENPTQSVTLGAMLYSHGEEKRGLELMSKGLNEDPEDIWSLVNAAAAFSSVLPQP